jgi:hypothetical protein
MSDTKYSFIPVIRQGLAAAINNPVYEDGVSQGNERMGIDIQLRVSAQRKGSVDQDPTAPQPKRIHLYGPGDILGFNPSVISRTEPLNDVGDFPPNGFPFAELPFDFPWRFTAAAAGVEGKLLPWISLIVLIAEGEGKEFFDPGDPFDPFPSWLSDAGENVEGLRSRRKSEKQLPSWIKVRVSSLPDIGEAWRWAHVQVTHSSDENLSDISTLKEILKTSPQRAVSHLLCARRLQPNTKYKAFIVPTFRLGLCAGRGIPFSDPPDALEIAWDSSEDMIELPYYYQWEFRTGMRGDFEQLVRLLKPRELKGIGISPIDCSQPGYDIPGVDEKPLGLEGTLMSLDTEFTCWGKDGGEITRFEKTDESIKIVNGMIKPWAHQAEISWITNDTTMSTTMSLIEYGTTAEYGQSLSDPDYKTEHRIVLENLNCATTYFVKVIARNNLYSASTKPDLKFTTPSHDENFRRTLGPALLNKAATNLQTQYTSINNLPDVIKNFRLVVTLNQAALNWETTQNTRCRVDYGLDTNYGEYQESADELSAHSYKIENLQLDTEYHLKISLFDLPDGVIVINDLQFHTPQMPKVVPPIYGKWHASRNQVNEDGTSETWIDVLNLDPRHRIAAGLGTKVIQDQQETLMASAWKQLGEINRANEIIRHAQLGCEASTAIYQKLNSLKLCDYLRILSPLNRHVIDQPSESQFPRSRRLLTRISSRKPVQIRESGKTVTEIFRNSPIPTAALDPAFRRLARPRGHLRKRQKPDRSFVKHDILERLNAPATDKYKLAAAGEAPRPDGMIGIGDVFAQFRHDYKLDDLAEFCEDQVTCEKIRQALSTKETTEDLSEENKELLRIVGRWLCRVVDDWLNFKPEEPEPSKPVDLTHIRNVLSESLIPQKTISSRVKSRLKLQNIYIQANDLQTFMGAPDFQQPMYEALRDISQDLLLPGIDKIPQNTIALLKTNGRFVESYMCGLNHGFASELRWRECPSDLTATYFRQFWDTSDYVPTAESYLLEPDQEAYLAARLFKNRSELLDEEKLQERLKDIKPIRFWRSSALGKNDNWSVKSKKENLIIVVKGDLLRKFPNTVIYAVDAVKKISNDSIVPGLPEYLNAELPAPVPIFPLFSGSLPPDITFLGFPFDAEYANGNGDSTHGVYFVLEERVSEARFALDEFSGETIQDGADGISKDELSWGYIPSQSDESLCIRDGEYINGLTPTGNVEGKDWNSSSAAVAWMTLQKPVRIAIHASQMIPDK